MKYPMMPATRSFPGRRVARARRLRAALMLAPVTLLAAGGCASTGSTFRSGVGDAHLEHPPYYAGASAAAARRDTGRIVHLPVSIQRGAAQSPIFDPSSGPGTPMGELLGEMNAFLDSLAAARGLTVRAAGERGIPQHTSAGVGTPPDVRFGCATASGLPDDECEARDDTQALGRRGQRMLLAVGRPSPAWVEQMRPVLEAAGARRALVVTLEVGQYLPRQEGWAGAKVVELGTGSVQSLPWLTSLETPVLVLQLTGAVVDEAGQAIRIGAEGIGAHRSRLLVSAIGGQELLGDEQVAELRTRRRVDLPGEPLAWQAALEHLVLGLLGRDARMP